MRRQLIQKLLCWFRHRWDRKRVVRMDSVRVVLRCSRCHQVVVYRESIAKKPSIGR